MAKNKKPRKAYRPKPSLENPVAYVLSGMALLGDSAYTVLIPCHEALAALVAGTGTRRDWEIVGGCLNISKAMDRTSYRREYQETLDKAIMAHALCGAQRINDGSFRYTLDQLDAVNQGMDLHEAMLMRSTQNELGAALREISRALRHEPTVSAARTAKEGRPEVTPPAITSEP